MSKTVRLIALLFFATGVLLLLRAAIVIMQPIENARSAAAELARLNERSVESAKPLRTSGLAAIWANDGGIKVPREERPALQGEAYTRNSVWDGQTIRLFAARNEVVSFALILEAGNQAVADVSVSISELRGPGKYKLKTAGEPDRPLLRDVSLFFIDYLQIRGLSRGLAWADYDERHIPLHCQRPWRGAGEGRGGWYDRPCADQHYPDIAVPIELQPTFSIRKGESQTLWGDVYIPVDYPPGFFRGELTVAEAGKITWRVPIEVEVLDIALPQRPVAKTMLALTVEDIALRYLGNPYPESGTALAERLRQLVDRHYQLAHRHRVSLVQGHVPLAQMNKRMLPRLDGSLFTRAQGYHGPGEGIGNDAHAIGLYGFWPWKGQGKKAMWQHAERWVRWFSRQRLDQKVEYFLYLEDESKDYPRLEKWARWLKHNPGEGKRLRSMATVGLLDGVEKLPSVSIIAAAADIGPRKEMNAAADAIFSDPARSLWFYNGRRPATGTFAIEDDGVALRQLPWLQHKLGIERWFYWNATYYENNQCSDGSDGNRQTDVFNQAHTFGCYSGRDREYGETGYNYFNGDGVLFYPGTDKRYPASSRNTDWPIASLRLKQWRRGLYDVDYLALAQTVDPGRTRAVINRMVPRGLWEYGVSDRRDPTWVRTDISWPIDPDVWEAARRELANIVLRGKTQRPGKDEEL